MNVQRQYSLPNCKLVLEGPAEGSGARPLVSSVDKVECYFSGYEKPLAGGREFLESLVSGVSDYAQEYLSGIPHLTHRLRQTSHRLVELKRVDKNLHRLMVQPQINDGAALSITPQQLDLTTVQLFDLVEAIDQLYADGQTMPGLVSNLSPLPKRYVAAQKPIAKRAAAPALGISGLAISAVALFFVPAPEVQRPQTSSTSQSTQTAEPTSASPPAPGGTPPSPAASAAADEVGVALDNALPVTDLVEQDRLKASLYNKIDQAWKTTPTFTKALEYRVGVATNGAVVGYKFISSEAVQYKQEVPLLELLQVPPTSSETGDASSEAIAQFRVIFEPNGTLEVSPWYAAPTASPSP